MAESEYSAAFARAAIALEILDSTILREEEHPADTHYPPGPLSWATQRQYLRRRRDLLDEQIAHCDSLRAQLAQMQNRMSGLRSKYHYASAPILALPLEILSEIFDWVVLPYQEIARSTRRKRLSDVCCVWRRIVLNQHSLWTDVGILITVDGDLSSARVRCSKSGALPINLTIHVNHPCSETDVGSTTERLRASLLHESNINWVRRISCLTWKGPTKLCAYLTTWMTEVFDPCRLRSIDLAWGVCGCLVCMRNPPPIDLQHITSPGLEVLRLKHLDISSRDSYPGFANLKILSMENIPGISWPSFKTVILHASRLTKLCLARVGALNIRLPGSDVDSHRQLSLPSLVLLSLDCVELDFLHAILATSFFKHLRTLKIKMANESHYVDDALGKTLTNALRRIVSHCNHIS